MAKEFKITSYLLSDEKAIPIDEIPHQEWEECKKAIMKRVGMVMSNNYSEKEFQ